MPDQLDEAVDWGARLAYCEYHIEIGDHTRAHLYCKEAIAKIAELERNNASYRDQIATMGQIRIEHPYGDPITIYQEQLLAKRQEAIAALHQELAALRADFDWLDQYTVRVTHNDALLFWRAPGASPTREYIADTREIIAARATTAQEGE